MLSNPWQFRPWGWTANWWPKQRSLGPLPLCPHSAVSATGGWGLWGLDWDEIPGWVGWCLFGCEWIHIFDHFWEAKPFLGLSLDGSWELVNWRFLALTSWGVAQASFRPSGKLMYNYGKWPSRKFVSFPIQHGDFPAMLVITGGLNTIESHSTTIFQRFSHSFPHISPTKITLWLFNIAIENGPFIDDFPSYKPPFSSGILHGYVK